MQQDQSAAVADIIADARSQLPAKRLRRYAQTASAVSSEASFTAPGWLEDHHAVVGCSWTL